MLIDGRLDCKSVFNPKGRTMAALAADCVEEKKRKALSSSRCSFAERK